MKEKLILLILSIIFSLNYSNAQKSFLIEELTFDNYNLKVIFFDPYENIIADNPEFKNLDSLQQGNIYNHYLLHNVIYDFQLSQDKNLLTHYILKGNHSKDIYSQNLTRNNIYQLDIVNQKAGINYYHEKEYSNQIDKTIDKLGFYGTIFENMLLVKNNQGKLGKELFGNFRLKIPYSAVRNNIMQIIGLDLFGDIDPRWVANDTDDFKNSFFDYQEKIDTYFKIERIKKTYVRTYNENGEIQNEYPRLTTDEDIKSFIGKMNRIGDVASLPFFKSTDTAILIDKDSLNSRYKMEIKNNAPIEKYLENIVVTKNPNDEIANITATLLIHGSSIDRGNYVERENYIAYFKDFKDLRLPYRILFSPVDDEQFKKPRIEIELDYLLHKK